MNFKLKQQIIELRGNGFGYGSIAKALNISKDQVASFCRRHSIDAGEATSLNYCKECGAPIIDLNKGKKKKFCSDKCRLKYFNARRKKTNSPTTYELRCQHCHKSFTASNKKNQKYCSHECYINDRFKGDN